MTRQPRSSWVTAGAAYVEFLIVIIPFLVLFLGLTQLALVYGAQLMVEHAASKAVRAAVVVLPDDHEEADYGGVPLNQIGSSGEGLAAYSTADNGGRLSAIRMAARYVLAPVSPPLDSLDSNSVADALGDTVGASVVAGLLGWTQWAVAVTFPDGDGGFKTSFGPREPVTARVTFLYKCSVPMARAIMCSSWSGLPKGRRETLGTNGMLLSSASQVAGWRVLALEAERTLPNQGR